MRTQENKLHVALARLFRVVSATMVRRLRKDKLPLTVERLRPIIERQGDGGWRSSERAESMNSLVALNLAVRGGPWLTGRVLVDLHALGVQVAEFADATLPFWSPLGGYQWLVDSFDGDDQGTPHYDVNPGVWVTRFLILPALQWHLLRLPSLDAADADADSFASDVLRVASDNRLRYRIVTPLSGINLDVSAGDMLTAGKFTVRRLSDTEQGQFFEDARAASPGTGRVVEPPQIALEQVVEGPRNAQHLPAGGDERALLTALELHGHFVAGGFAQESIEPEWIHSFKSSSPLVLPGRSTRSTLLMPAEFDAISTTAKVLTRHNLLQPRSARDLALHRFVAGAARMEITDAILDYTIALEALLLPDDSRGDLSYRFRMHGAHYLSDSQNQRAATATELRDLYKMRSRLVHGGRYPEQAEMITMRDSAQELARRGLLRAVHEGFPTSETYERMMLGAVERNDQLPREPTSSLGSSLQMPEPPALSHPAADRDRCVISVPLAPVTRGLTVTGELARPAGQAVQQPGSHRFPS